MSAAIHKLRAWWSHKQALDGRLSKASAAEVLAESGRARSIAGVNPYLTLFGRAGISREAADQAVAKLEIHELPAARGCTYIVPAADFALASPQSRSIYFLKYHRMKYWSPAPWR